ncbi:hypothetical protein L3Q82_001577 [Scortum barcoo]|uniref:Uncharacterized protein n=1 Tax=Scortum barcoo TaxID=214431 RepID=A0ACB8W7H2_9TELE|nr:hypothetical protein L3Q82_001577 [Scortum barcoo]
MLKARPVFLMISERSTSRLRHDVITSQEVTAWDVNMEVTPEVRAGRFLSEAKRLLTLRLVSHLHSVKVYLSCRGQRSEVTAVSGSDQVFADMRGGRRIRSSVRVLSRRKSPGPGPGLCAGRRVPELLLRDMSLCYRLLRTLVPGLPAGRTTSRVEILQHVIDYIQDLQTELDGKTGN